MEKNKARPSATQHRRRPWRHRWRAVAPCLLFTLYLAEQANKHDSHQVVISFVCTVSLEVYYRGSHGSLRQLWEGSELY
jgi:hypothetical protein